MTQTISNHNECALCSLNVSKHPIFEDSLVFCCLGCQAVFNILTAKNIQGQFHEQPIFRQAVKAGLISNPVLLEKLRTTHQQSSNEDFEKLHLEINDMWCLSCAQIIKLILLQENGIRQCTIDYTTDLACIEYSPRFISKDRIYALIKSLGYAPVPLEDAKTKAVSSSFYLRFIICAFCALNVMMFSYPIYAGYFDADYLGYSNLFSWLSMGASLPVITYCAYPIYRRFLASIQIGYFGMETLVILGSVSAFGLSMYELIYGSDRVYFDTMTIIITFVLLGKIIEAQAKFSTKNSLLQLNKQLPKRGRKLFPDLTQKFTPLKDILVGDNLVAFAGEKIVLDGIVIEGEGACDESLMTGEAWPVPKGPGIQVLAGSIVQNGRLIFRATKTFYDSALHKIIETIEKDIEHKISYVRSADVIVRWFVPTVVFIALATAAYCVMNHLTDGNKTVIETAIVRAISVLLISCPCAIGIAAPLAESYLINGLAGMGAIVRNRGCLAVLGKETVFAFDKTGTVTVGKFTVLSGIDNLEESEKMILKNMASQSTHPISIAISLAIETNDNLSLKITKIEEFTGKGLKGYYLNDCYLLGSAHFLQQSGIEIINDISKFDKNQMVSTVYFAKNGICLAQLILGDQVRSDAKACMESLFPAKTLLLSGDSRSSVETVAHTCGFNTWKASCSPFDKKAEIESLREKGEIVCMLGDGINDALALTEAHVAVSVVNATDVSIQVSDLLLTTDRLSVIPKIRELAKKGQRIIAQNLFWAFFYNIIGIGLAVTGVLSPIFAAFAMVTSSLFVLFNAQRIR